MPVPSIAVSAHDETVEIQDSLHIAFCRLGVASTTGLPKLSRAAAPVPVQPSAMKQSRGVGKLLCNAPGVLFVVQKLLKGDLTTR